MIVGERLPLRLLRRTLIGLPGQLVAATRRRLLTWIGRKRRCSALLTADGHHVSPHL